MNAPLTLPDGRSVVPDNRWDLVDRGDLLDRGNLLDRWDSTNVGPSTPTVSVVVPYYNQPHQLALVLAALASQTYPRESMDVVVADDGSSEPPDTERWASKLSVSVVRQEDLGFRAAAARNLGAGASTGSILCFLDADTVPAPDYIAHAVRLPAVLPDCVVVGRRVHADLSGLTESTVGEWLAGRASSDDATEPGWLADAYARTSDLLEPGWDGYKYILSAVLTCTRELFDAVGGFDESFTRYGGEDWEFANRAFMMGAVFARQSSARAWHDGPDWAERAVPDRTHEKNAEALALAPLVTDPRARSAGLHYRVPDVVVRVLTEGHTPASLTVTVAEVVRGNDCAVWFVGDESIVRELGVEDSRVRSGKPDGYILARCRFVVDVRGRVMAPAKSLSAMAEDLGPGGAGGVVVDFDSPEASVTMWTSRALHRAQRWATPLSMSELQVTEALFGVRRRRASEVGLTVATEEPWLSW